jgi:microsomal prostaglandin-E synthase 2
LQKHWVVYDSEQSFKLIEADHGVLCGDDCRWVDNHLVHLLSPNIYRTPKEALEAFDYLATSGRCFSQSSAHDIVVVYTVFVYAWFLHVLGSEVEWQSARNFSTMERVTGKYNGATAIFFIGKRLKKQHNITDERASLYEAAEEWVKALDNRTFMGGSKPNLADLALFGVLWPIQHLQTGKDMTAQIRAQKS